MNSLFQKYKWIKYTIGATIVALGVLIIILACINMGQLQNVINIVLASTLLLFGVAFICLNLFQETHRTITMSMIIGGLSLTLGIMLLVSRFALHVTFPPVLLVYFVSTFTLALGVAMLIKAITMIVYRQKTPMIVLMFVLATVGIVLGILGLCFANKLVAACYIILGISFVVIGIIAIVFAVMNSKDKKE